jgi:hypothetical protein
MVARARKLCGTPQSPVSTQIRRFGCLASARTFVHSQKILNYGTFVIRPQNFKVVMQRVTVRGKSGARKGSYELHQTERYTHPCSIG